MNLSKAVEGFAISFLADGRSGETLKGHKRTLKMLVTFGGDKPVESITADELRKFMAYLASDYTPNRVNGDKSPLRSASLARTWAALRSFWRWASVEFELPKNPALALKMPKVSNRAILPLTEDEVKKLLKSTEQDRLNTERDAAMVVVLLDTGLRISELARLKMRDLDLQAGRAEIKSVGSGTKSKSRFVMLGKSARRYLWRYLATRDDTDDKDAPVFSTRDGRSLSRGSLRLALDRLGRRAGVKCHPHQFRHTFAISYLRADGDLLTLQALLGHSDMQMVAHYVRLAQIDLTEAHKRASPADK